MLSSGTPPAICARCRLRETLLVLRSQRQAWLPLHFAKQSRPFTNQPHRREEFREKTVERREKSYVWKRFSKHGEGRITGKPGKRQRVVSEKLSTKAIDERVSPSQIIIFQDVKDELTTPGRAPIPPSPTISSDGRPRKVLSAKEIEDEVVGRQPAPGETEVNASIDDLRPGETVVDEGGFAKLKAMLLKGYTFRQLSQYLVKSIPASPGATSTFSRKRAMRVSNDINELGPSKWQSGETPLERRHRNMAQISRPNSKLGVADQILRLVWHITVQSELQRTGELEISLQPWQLSMFFDLSTNDGNPYYHRFINPPILLDASKVLVHRPDNVMRIVGRQQVAEEIARQLRLALLRIERTEVNLTGFVSSAKSTSPRGAHIFDDEELQYVSDMTKCVIVPADQGHLSIYSEDAANRRNAQRTLMSLLNCGTPSSFDEVSKAGLEIAVSPTNLAVDDLGLHRRYRKFALVRKAEPMVSEQRHATQSRDHMPGSGRARLSLQLPQVIEQEIARVPEPANGTELWPLREDSYWRNEVRLTEWEARFCRLLVKASAEEDSKQEGKQSSPVTQRVVLGSEALLSHLTPLEVPRPLDLQMGETRGKISFDRRLPWLEAHFVPFPSKLANLPRIAMRFRFSAPTSTGEPRQISLIAITAKLDSQRLSVPLPGEVVDLVFQRSSSVIARIPLVWQDKRIRHFCNTLRESFERGEGALDAPSEVIFSLPRFLVHDAESKGTDPGAEVEARYMLEQFEQVQAVAFAPSADILNQEGVDPEVVKFINDLPAGASLNYREADTGAVRGSSTGLSLRMPSHFDEQNALSHVSEEHSVVEDQSQSEAVSRYNQFSHEEVDTADQGAQRGGVQQTVTETTGAAHAVEKNADSSKSPSANTSSGLVAAALSVARLLTRGNSGSLKSFGESR